MTIDNHEDQNFVFGSDDHEPEFHQNTSDARIEKLNQKVTLLSILIPCIIGVLIVFIYFDMKNKVVQVHTSGSTEVHKISDELSQTIETIKTDSLKIETTLNKKLTGIESSVSGLSSKMKKAEKNIQFMTSAKADKKAIEKEIENLKKESLALRNNLSELTAQNAKLVTIAGELKGRLNDVDDLNKTMERLEIDLAYLKTNMLEKEELKTELKKQKRFYQLELQELSSTVNKKIESIKASQKKASATKPAPVATNSSGVVEQDIN